MQSWSSASPQEMAARSQKVRNFPRGITQYSTRLFEPRYQSHTFAAMDADLPLLRQEPVSKPGVKIARPRVRFGASLLKQIFQGFVVLGLGLASYYLISNYFVQSVQVVGSSMTPTLHDSEFYLLNRWIYHFRQPRRFYVVVIRDPSVGCYSVKRIVGVAGDSIFLKNGDVYLNGKKLMEPYLAPRTDRKSTRLNSSHGY